MGSVSYALTCDGCGGRHLTLAGEAEMTIRRVGHNRVQVHLPLPMLCLDCGGTSHRMKRVG